MTDDDKEQRNFTDADIKKFVDCMEDRLEQRFYVNFGRGVWAFVWRAAITVLLALAAYGHYTKGS